MDDDYFIYYGNKVVDFFTEEEIYGQRQSVWKLNIEKYYETMV